MVLDTHIYIFAMESFVPIHMPWVYQIYIKSQQRLIERIQRDVPVVVGEWCICNKYAEKAVSGKSAENLLIGVRRQPRKTNCVRNVIWKSQPCSFRHGKAVQAGSTGAISLNQIERSLLMKSGKKAGIFQDVWKTAGLNSRTDKKKVTLREMIFGYFLGPLLVLSMTSVVASYYLTFYRTYEDVVNQRVFLTVLPLISVIPMALSNIVVGIMVGKTRTKQGKARPYILMAAPMLLISGILVFCIPYFSLGVRMVWMVVTYNLFAAIANPVYGTSHYLMVSLSTRDLDQRGKLSVVSNIPAVAGNGLISSIVMPLILGWINSAGSNGVMQNRWQVVMTMFAVLAFVGCILEYFFTRERITEEDMVETDAE